MFIDQNGRQVSASEIGAQLETKAKKIADQLIALELMSRAHRLAMEAGLNKIVCPVHNRRPKNFRLVPDGLSDGFKLKCDYCCDRLRKAARRLEDAF